LAASAAARIFGWDAKAGPSVTFNQLVVDAETLGRIRALRDADSFDADCHPARAQVDFACHGPLVLPP